MPSASFTRDEAILALDVLYLSDTGKLSVDSKEMIDLSALLNRLPIHPIENRPSYFRNTSGVTQQLRSLQTSLRTGKRNPSVGIVFYNIFFEFEKRHDELHEIAQAIRRNERYYSAEYGCANEDLGFPEGILLGHLHSIIEAQNGAKYKLAEYCEVCNMMPELYYQSCGNLLQAHLTVPPVELEGNKKYDSNQFITVCPTCHMALHKIRPWRTKGLCKEILR